MTIDSHQQGRARGHADGLAGRPRPEPRKDLAYADPGYQQYWLAVADGYRAGTAERQTRQAAAA